VAVTVTYEVAFVTVTCANLGLRGVRLLLFCFINVIAIAYDLPLIARSLVIYELAVVTITTYLHLCYSASYSISYLWSVAFVSCGNMLRCNNLPMS
jgi:hypothetical protein